MQSDDSAYFDEAILKLKSVARVGQRIEAAQVQLINLDAVAERAGDRWPGMANRMRAGTVGFLVSRLDKADIIVPCGDGFLIIFAKLDEAAAKRRMAELQEDLTAFYVGEEGLAELRARMNHASLTEADIVAIAAPPKPACAPKADLKLTFAPVWSARAQVIACYFHVPYYEENGCFEFGYDPFYRVHGTHDVSDFLEFDLALLARGLAAAEKHAAAGARSVLGISVHASTLRRPQSRIAYVNALLAAPALLVQRLIVKIAEIELGAPEGQIIEMTRPLRGVVPQVALEFHHRQRPPASLNLLGCGLVGFQLPRHVERITGAQQQALLQSISVWRSAIAPKGLKLFVDRFDSVAVLRAAAPMIDFASSAQFWTPQVAPGDIRAVPLPEAPRATM